jgi:hypothetical protein
MNDDDLKRWEEAENAAIEAERQVHSIGQLGSSPEAAEMFAKATELRRAADGLLAGMLAELRGQAPFAPDGGPPS